MEGELCTAAAEEPCRSRCPAAVTGPLEVEAVWYSRSGDCWARSSGYMHRRHSKAPEGADANASYCPQPEQNAQSSPKSESGAIVEGQRVGGV